MWRPKEKTSERIIKEIGGKKWLEKHSRARTQSSHATWVLRSLLPYFPLFYTTSAYACEYVLCTTSIVHRSNEKDKMSRDGCRKKEGECRRRRWEWEKLFEAEKFHYPPIEFRSCRWLVGAPLKKLRVPFSFFLFSLTHPFFTQPPFYPYIPRSTRFLLQLGSTPALSFCLQRIVDQLIYPIFRFVRICDLCDL